MVRIHFTFLFALIFPLCVAADVILINSPLSEQDSRYQYTEDLLKLVLLASSDKYGDYRLERAQAPMSRNRALTEMIDGDLLHVMAEAPKPEWEAQLIPVRIPIRKGVQGYRLFIIRDQDRKLMGTVQSLKDLMSLPTGSGAQWSTRVVMEEAGFTVMTSTNYDSLFEMLHKGRFVTFGRGVNEAYREVATYGKVFPDLVVDEHVALFIPLPTYYFVTPTQPKLAERIRDGLERMLEDGSFDAFFFHAHCDDLKLARLADRRVFRISNSNLSKDTPHDVARYWLDPMVDLDAVCPQVGFTNATEPSMLDQ